VNTFSGLLASKDIMITLAVELALAVRLLQDLERVEIEQERACTNQKGSVKEICT
jgi:hypothetical protein